eukprot:367317_1
MSEHLERILAQFLKVNRKECCDKDVQNEYKKQSAGFESVSIRLCKLAHPKGLKTKDETVSKYRRETKEDINREQRVYPIIWKKFNEFRLSPKRIKFNTISDNLKRFFMDETEEKIVETGQQKWQISFDLITSVYQNVIEIHFINEYRFDDDVL